MASQLQTVVARHIDSLVNYFEPFLGLANCHMVDYFTKSAYCTYISKEIRDEVEGVGFEAAISILFGDNKLSSEAPNLVKYIEAAHSFALSSCYKDCLSIEEFGSRLSDLGCESVDKFKLSMFMTPKKSHEVEVMTTVVASVSKFANVSHLVDIGDGKGYLSSMLALHHKIPVLGVDASETNTCGAVRRSEKLSKVWKGIVTKPNKASPVQNVVTNPDSSLYKQVTRFVSNDMDFVKLISDVYLEAPSVVGLVGLHTCGDLAANSLKMFAGNPSIRMICNVGCCYHLLTEGQNSGFPLSTYLKNKNFEIGRNARMVASQSVDRVFHNRELPNASIYYRALLQILFEKWCPVLPTKNVGKFRKSQAKTNFVDYARAAMDRVGVDIDVTDEELKGFESAHKHRVDELSVFYLLRCKLSAIVESLVLLDRLMFLYERGFENSFVIRLFDPVVSPRCYGIVSLKGKST